MNPLRIAPAAPIMERPRDLSGYGGLTPAQLQYLEALKFGGGAVGIGGTAGLIGDRITQDTDGTLLLNPLTAAVGVGGLGAGAGALIGARTAPTPAQYAEVNNPVRAELKRRALAAENIRPGAGAEVFARNDRGYRDGSIRRGRALLGTTAGATVGAGAALLHSLLDELGQGNAGY